MRSISKRILGGTGIAAVLAGTMVALAAQPAAAEPTGTPAATDIVAVGSDTIQGLYDQFQADHAGLQSFDATGAATITPKAGCATITRPNGSGAGIAALGANATTSDGRHYCVDVARSSRTPSATDPAGLSWLALGTDAVSWAAVDGGNAPAGLTAAQLFHIFRCDAGWTHWNDPNIGGTSADTIVPVLPQTASGTRSFFLSALNASQNLTGALTPGPCVDVTSQPEENEGVNPVFAASNPAARDIVYPYSAAVYAAQAYNGRGTGAQGRLTVRQVDGVNPVTGGDAPRTENPDFPGSFQRTVFDVVRTASLGNPTGRDGDLDSLVNWQCGDATADADLRSFGFGPLPSLLCGAALYTT